MARNRPHHHSQETSGKPPEEDVLANSVPNSKPKEPVVAPPIKTYRVIQGGYVMVNGSKTGVRNGKVISEANYDIASLKLQGIVLEEIPAQGALNAAHS